MYQKTSKTLKNNECDIKLKNVVCYGNKICSKVKTFEITRVETEMDHLVCDFVLFKSIL